MSTETALEAERKARHTAEAKLTEAHLMLAEIRDELAADMDVVDGPGGESQPNKAMRLCQWIDEVLPKPTRVPTEEDLCDFCGGPLGGACRHARCLQSEVDREEGGA